jgi:hypothetical protein
LQRGFCPDCGSHVLAREDHRPRLGSSMLPAWMIRAGSSPPRTSSPRTPNPGTT